MTSKTDRPLKNLLEHYYSVLPKFPKCTDDFIFGVRGYPKEIAVQKAIIQHNAPNNLYWMVFDIDCEEAGASWIYTDSLAPNLIVSNPKNGHAHYFYGLKEPVHTQTGSRLAPIKYFGAIYQALVKDLEADVGYRQFLSKNPLNQSRWNVLRAAPDLYTLKDLAQGLDLEGPDGILNKKLNLLASGGRNCELFAHVSQWAYKECSKYSHQGSWFSAVLQQSHEYNFSFDFPLPSNEILSTAKSIANYTWEHCRHSIKEWGEPGRQKSIETRSGASNSKASKALQLKKDGYSAREIAQELNCARTYVYSLLEKAKKVSDL